MTVTSSTIEKEIANLVRIQKLLKNDEKVFLEDFEPVVPFKGFNELREKICSDLLFQLNQISYREFKELDNQQKIELFNEKLSGLIKVISDIKVEYNFFDMKEAMAIEEFMDELSFSELMRCNFTEIKNLFTFSAANSTLKEQTGASLFYLMNALREIDKYTTALDTLKNGVPENNELDALIKKELKINGFAMSKGFPHDLLVHDRNILNNPHTIFKEDGSINAFYINVETDNLSTFSTQASINTIPQGNSVKILPSEQNIENAKQRLAQENSNEIEDNARMGM